MIDNTDLALLDALPGTGEFDGFQPHRFNRVFHKGDDGKIKETKDQKAFADVVSQKWNHYKNTYGETEAKYMKGVDAQNSEAAHSFARGSANQHTQKAFSEAKENLTDNLTTAGINPNSGKFKDTTAKMSAAEGESTGETMARADNSQTDEHMTGIMNVVGMGQGKSATATAGLGGLADAAESKAASDAYKAFNDNAMTQQVVGTVAGAATSYGLNGKEAPQTDGYSLTAGRQGDIDYNAAGLQPGQRVG